MPGLLPAPTDCCRSVAAQQLPTVTIVGRSGLGSLDARLAAATAPLREKACIGRPGTALTRNTAPIRHFWFWRRGTAALPHGRWAYLEIDLDERLGRGAAQGDGPAEQLGKEGGLCRRLRLLGTAARGTRRVR